MGFPQEVADKALVACGRMCCICHKFCGTKMELHHIKQKAYGGEDTYENCIPLCFDCHSDMGKADPKHPKGKRYTESELIAHRDSWYQKVRDSNGLAPQEMTSVDAARAMTQIFLDNFPKLQRIAEEIAQQRVDELCSEILKTLEKQQNSNYGAFSDPDVQFVLWNTERDYARFGQKEMLEILASLVAKRVQKNEDFYMKTIIDRALEIVNYLTPQHLDYLSMLFIVKQVHFNSINSLDSLQRELQYMESIFSPAGEGSVSLLNTLGCFDIAIGEPAKMLANGYGLDPEQVKNIFPKKFNVLHSDYCTSHIGTILAITNCENKCRYRFDPKIWIHS